MHEAEIARQDSWVETEATIISCKPRVFSLAGDAVPIFAQDIPAPEYTVTFRYVVAHRAFTGRYRTQSEQEVGTTLTIAYDPLRPGRNTGPDLSQNVRYGLSPGQSALVC